MANLDTIRKRLEKYILSSGHTFREVSLSIGRKDSYIQQYIKYGYPKRLKEVDRKRVCNFLNINEEELIDDDLSKSSTLDTLQLNLHDLKSNITDFVCIDICDQDYQNQERIIGRMAFNQKEFYGWCNGNPHHLKILRFNSDNMEPTLLAGTLVIYDSNSAEYSGDGLYIIRYDDNIMLKRLQKTAAATYALKSDNPRYQDITCHKDEFEIIGRVVNALQSRPL